MDQQHTQRYRRRDGDENEPMELNDVLEPYDGQEEYYIEEQDSGDDPDGLYDNYEDDGEYSDYHEEIDIAGRFKVAMGVFDTVSILVGVLVVLILVAMLISLVNWLRSDIMHSMLLLQSGLQ